MALRIGVAFPQLEIGGCDAIALRDYVQAVEGLGFSHVISLDHVLGADPGSRHAPLKQPYTHESTIREPFMLFSHWAAVTTRLEFATRVLVLPQRQTALVAKQAAELSLLSNGRFRLGIGLGWNYVEYEALGQEFRSRSARIEEQVTLLRELWSQPLVDFEGQWHRVTRAAICPRPQSPIPIWMGGMADAALRRISRIADGWFPDDLEPKEPESAELIAKMWQYLEEAGRKPSDLGIEGNLFLNKTASDEWASTVEAWEQIGAQAVTLMTTLGDLSSPTAHIGLLERFKHETGLALN